MAKAPDVADRTAAWLALAGEHSALLSGTPPSVVLEEGRGTEVWDVDGRRFIDFLSGQNCMQTGHSHPRVTAVAVEQAQKLMQIGVPFTNVPRIELARKLASLMPFAQARTFFSSTGSEANEYAIRLAKRSTGSFEIVSILRGYHGLTLGSFSASTSGPNGHAGYGPLMAGVCAIPTPYPYRCHFKCGSCDLRCWEVGKELIERTTSGRPAAIIMEFIVGGGGVIPIPANFARAVREFCDERGTLIIADEALTGIGRTGAWFAYEHTGVAPDIVVLAKSLGGGVPVSAITAPAEVFDRALATGFMLGASHQGDPMQCAIGLVNVEVIEEENLLENARAMGERLGRGLERIAERSEIVGDVRGIGLFWGVEIVSDKESRVEDHARAAKITSECLARGLIIGGPPPGARVNVLRLVPPLVVTAAEIDESLEILAAAVDAAA
jgi:2,2-dialkylglycine decarboxylase (pyruvate)